MTLLTVFLTIVRRLIFLLDRSVLNHFQSIARFIDASIRQKKTAEKVLLALSEGNYDSEDDTNQRKGGGSHDIRKQTK